MTVLHTEVRDGTLVLTLARPEARNAIDKALANPADGVAQPWRSDSSPANGVVTVRKSYVADGRKCRDLLIANSYKTLKGEAEHMFCQDGAGQWKLVQ